MSSRTPGSDSTEPSISPQQLFEAWSLNLDGTSGDPAGVLSIKAFFSEFDLGECDLSPAPVPADRATGKGALRRWLRTKTHTAMPRRDC